MMKIAIAADHAGFDLKQLLIPEYWAKLRGKRFRY